MMRTSDYRARMHPGYWAFAVHRISGLALAVFLPLHFWALGLALQGEAALDSFLSVTDNAVFKVGEWGLVTLLAVHLTGGARLLLIEFAPWSGPRKNLIAWAIGCAAAAGLAFALALIG
jgi:fumarate reductase subunit D